MLAPVGRNNDGQSRVHKGKSKGGQTLVVSSRGNPVWMFASKGSAEKNLLGRSHSQNVWTA